MGKGRSGSKSKPTRQLTAALWHNSHSIVIMAPNEFVDFALTQKKRSGMTESQALAWLERIIQSVSNGSMAAKNNWQRFNSTIKSNGSYLPVWSDSKALAALALETSCLNTESTATEVKAMSF